MPFPHINPVMLQLGPVPIRWYGVAYAAGMILGWRYCVMLVRNAKLWRKAQPSTAVLQVDNLMLWLFLGVLVGGRLGYVLIYGRGEFFARPWEIFEVWQGGMSFHGGFVGVAIALALFARANHLDLLRLGDLIAPCAPRGLFFGRLANFINGELWGRPTQLPWGVVFPNAPDVPPVPRHPSQLYEAGLEGIALFLLLRLATHGLRWLPKRGANTGLFMLAYGAFRIGLENVRNPDLNMPHFPFGLTMGMMLSAPMVLVGIGLTAWALRPGDVSPDNPAALASATPVAVEPTQLR
ncbi:prolipoprotein diacylglyceryl transferase [Phenylobacterium sp.]|uniref:prolipoprotein diacylglyceryl transferase n=1 Tax=Phenylobacterium sp. TaxID=1871053 RepID=UPI002E2F9EE3|nr:prolipoprotein diacylglyceryl transferase [Phenylobacterium sp.]HEX4712763.1 prolipoprotein diacylglyceryl transferase [Phenylobacterium sp.]